jgi:hypothetical protein
MNETRVESTVLRALGYDGGRGILQVEFCTRAIYHYYGVPAAVYDALLGASSKGSYFNRVIGGHFPYALCASAQTGLAGKGRCHAQWLHYPLAAALRTTSVWAW